MVSFLDNPTQPVDDTCAAPTTLTSTEFATISAWQRRTDRLIKGCSASAPGNPATPKRRVRSSALTGADDAEANDGRCGDSAPKTSRPHDFRQPGPS